jgi:hypothetical protein
MHVTAPHASFFSAFPLLNGALQQGMKLSMFDRSDEPLSASDIMLLGTELFGVQYLKYVMSPSSTPDVAASRFAGLAAAVSEGRMPHLHTLAVSTSMADDVDKAAVVLPLVAAAASRSTPCPLRLELHDTGMTEADIQRLLASDGCQGCWVDRAACVVEWRGTMSTLVLVCGRRDDA